MAQASEESQKTIKVPTTDFEPIVNAATTEIQKKLDKAFPESAYEIIPTYLSDGYPVEAGGSCDSFLIKVTLLEK